MEKDKPKRKGIIGKIATLGKNALGNTQTPEISEDEVIRDKYDKKTNSSPYAIKTRKFLGKITESEFKNSKGKVNKKLRSKHQKMLKAYLKGYSFIDIKGDKIQIADWK